MVAAVRDVDIPGRVHRHPRRIRQLGRASLAAVPAEAELARPGDRPDHARCIDLPHAVVAAVRDVDIPGRVHCDPAGRIELRFGCGRTTTSTSRIAGSGERVDDPRYIDLAYPVVDFVGQVSVTGGISRNPAWPSQGRVRCRNALDGTPATGDGPDGVARQTPSAVRIYEHIVPTSLSMSMRGHHKVRTNAPRIGLVACQSHEFARRQLKDLDFGHEPRGDGPARITSQGICVAVGSAYLSSVPHSFPFEMQDTVFRAKQRDSLAARAEAYDKLVSGLSHDPQSTDPLPLLGQIDVARAVHRDSGYETKTSLGRRASVSAVTKLTDARVGRDRTGRIDSPDATVARIGDVHVSFTVHCYTGRT